MVLVSKIDLITQVKMLLSCRLKSYFWLEISSEILPTDIVTTKGPSLDDYNGEVLIGKGAFSTVYRYSLKETGADSKLPGSMAVKILLKADDASREPEMNVFIALRHRNIATGMCTCSILWIHVN